MSFEWQEIKLADAIEIIGGGTPKTSVTEYWGGSIPWLSVGDFNNVPRYVEFAEKGITEKGLENSSTKLLNAGDLIISARGTVGALAQLKRPMAFNQSCYGIRGIANTSNTDFIFYALKVEIEQLKRLAHGGVFDTITRDTFKNISIFLPSFGEQTLIANFLGALDDRITLLHETNETLEAIAQALFKSWFVDFDPVRAKQSGKKPEGMDETTASLFPDSFKQSELGEIPTGWEIKKLKEILDLFGGQAFKSKDYISEGIFVLRTNNFKQGIVLKNDNDVFLPNSFLDSYKNFVCEEFDYHLVMVGASIGNTGMIFPHLLPALRNQNMWCFRPKNKQVLSRLYTKFIVDKISKELINFASGSARDFFKRDDFKNHKLIIPHDKVLKSYAEITDPILERISINYNNIDILNNLRDTLLPKLISGKLKMTDIKKEINNKTNVTA